MSTSIPITEEQHIEIMRAMNENTIFYKRNPQVIAILITESSTGLRLGDVLSMKLSQIHTSEKGYRLKIKEKKIKYNTLSFFANYIVKLFEDYYFLVNNP